ncbi:hypothetical protein M9H77_03399 [Catharanthus roseus]|uniref:Uncharacterized protein n=1 Tax=Catharanthus roseus TaxID=4058 RepID=A0ACC0CB74_CATRO|nr:hypothetical protein M9H77_03399 [Catharanthus roseus]
MEMVYFSRLRASSLTDRYIGYVLCNILNLYAIMAEPELDGRKEEKRVTLSLNNLFVSFFHHMVRGSKKRSHSTAASTPRGFYNSDIGFYTFGDLDYISAAAILESDAYIYSFVFICCGVIIEACLSSSTCPPTPAASSAHSPVPSSQGIINFRIIILSTADSFSKQSDHAKVFTEIMKAHFVEAHSSFWKVLYRIKNMWYTEFEKRYDGI